MKKLIPKEERMSELIKFGAPKTFIENIGKIPELQFRLEDVDGAYFYFPTIENYRIFNGLNIIPIYDEGETFRVFAYNESTQSIFHFELENDEIYTDFGTNWDLLLLDIMIQFYEDDLDEVLDVESFKKVGDQLGFNQSETLYKLLDISVEEYNEKYNDMDKGIIEIAKKLKIV